MLGVVLSRLFGHHVQPRIAGELLAVVDEMEALRFSDDTDDGGGADPFCRGYALHPFLQFFVLRDLGFNVLLVLLKLLSDALQQFPIAFADLLVYSFHMVYGLDVVQQLRLHLRQVCPEACQLTQFMVYGLGWLPGTQFAAYAAHQRQAACVHGVGLGLDALILAELAGLVGQHYIYRLPYLVQVVGELLIIGAGWLHKKWHRKTLLRLAAAPLHQLVETRLALGKVNALRAAAYVAAPVIHEEAGGELVLGNVNAHALAEILV